MVAMRRERGSGTVVALVIFVVLTFVAGGAAVWLAQQASAAKMALKENQDAFRGAVAAYFEEQGAPLEEETGPYDIRFGPKAYGGVRSYLDRATSYEEVVKLVGWSSPDAVEEALRISPIQKGLGAAYQTVSGLLGAYEQSFADQKDAIEKLRASVDSLQDQLKEKTETIAETESNLRGEINKVAREFNSKLDEWHQKNQRLVETYEAQRKETAQCQQKYDKDIAEANAKIAKLQEKVEELKKLQALRFGEQKPRKLVAEGKILQVERAYKLVIVEGGEDVQRKTDQTLVVYSQSPTGKRTKKGQVIVTDVHKYTASATVIEENEQIAEGDLFVSTKVWDEFHKG